MPTLNCFGSEQIKIVNNAVAMAEELVSNYYKMSASQWLGPRYDVKTLKELNREEIIHGPFAQLGLCHSSTPLVVAPRRAADVRARQGLALGLYS